MFNILKIKQTKSDLTNNFFLTEIYNSIILINVSFYILIIALSICGFKKIYF